MYSYPTKKPRELEAEQFDVTLFRKVISTRRKEKEILFFMLKRKEMNYKRKQQATTSAMHDSKSTYYFSENKRGIERGHVFSEVQIDQRISWAKLCVSISKLIITFIVWYAVMLLFLLSRCRCVKGLIKIPQRSI